MSRSLSYLRRGLLGIAFVGSMGFGVKQALAEDVWQGTGETCDGADPNRHTYCFEVCYQMGYMRSRCNVDVGLCECRFPAE